MSVTTVLVPVLEPEVEAFFDGGAEGDRALATALRRAAPLRARVARVDAVREALHEVLFPAFERSLPRPSPFAAWLRRTLGGGPVPAPRSTGYDPFVHLFGRSLPVTGAGAREVANRLGKLLPLEDESVFTAELAGDLRSLDPRAAELFLAEPAVAPPAELERRVRAQYARVRESLQAQPPEPEVALDAAVRISAWSWPVWRLDGEMLPGLVATLGATAEPGPAESLFAEAASHRPELAASLERLPKLLEGFSGPGTFLASQEVKLLARSLNLYASRIALNAATSGEAVPVLMRNVRLLEEALHFCEAQGLALSEAAGVEWHER